MNAAELKGVLDKLSEKLGRVTYEGLFNYFTGIKKASMHASIEYTGVSSDDTGKIKSKYFSGEVLDVFYDCVVFRSGESECCFPYHAISRIDSVEPKRQRKAQTASATYYALSSYLALIIPIWYLGK